MREIEFIEKYVNQNSKYGGYCSIVALLKDLREEFLISMNQSKFYLLNFIWLYEKQIGLQEASSNKTRGLEVVWHGKNEKNFLFIRFK